MEPRQFGLQTLANALGTLIAIAVAYLVGVLAGVFTFELLLVILSLLVAVASLVLFARMVRGRLGAFGDAVRRAERARVTAEQAEKLQALEHELAVLRERERARRETDEPE